MARRSRIAAAGAAMQSNGFRDLIADGHDGIERRHRLLKNHGDFVTANAAHVLIAKRRQIRFLKKQLATNDPADSLRKQLQYRAAR